MKTITLFDDLVRKDKRGAHRNENIYNYINTSGREEIGELRNYLEKCFSLYPDGEKKEIKNRLKSMNHFHSTFFEMFLQEMLISANFDIKLHPVISGTENRPDFLITKDGKSLYLEAKVDYNMTDKERTADNTLREVEDIIDRMNIKNYRLVVRKIKVKSKEQPSLKHFKIKLKNDIETLDYDACLRATYSSDFSQKVFHYDDDSLEVECQIYAVPKDYGDGRAIQMDASHEAKNWDSSIKSIRRSLDNKSSRYGEMNAPFIIALNCLDIFTKESDIRSALLGNVKYITNKHDESLENSYYHKNNGFFSYSNTEKNNNVSAVLVYRLNLENIDNPEYFFILNPNAKYPIDTDLFPFNYIKLKNGNFVEVKK